jgi:hypothetical protein
VRFRGATAASGGDKLTLSPEKCALKQRAYELRRADWLLRLEAENGSVQNCGVHYAAAAVAL